MIPKRVVRDKRSQLDIRDIVGSVKKNKFGQVLTKPWNHNQNDHFGIPTQNVRASWELKPINKISNKANLKNVSSINNFGFDKEDSPQNFR
jgi:hypothetical protein